MLPSIVLISGENFELDETESFEDLRHFGAFVGVDGAAV